MTNSQGLEFHNTRLQHELLMKSKFVVILAKVVDLSSFDCTVLAGFRPLVAGRGEDARF